MGWAVFWRRRIVNHRHHDSSVNTSTTNASIKNRTNWGDSMRCSILSANGIKKVNWFCIAGCEMNVMGCGGVLATRRCGRIVNHHHDSSVNTSTTNASIKNRTNRGNSLRCNLSSANGIKNLLVFASLAVKSSRPESSQKSGIWRLAAWSRTTITTVLWIPQQSMLQSRIGQIEVIL